MIFWGITFKNHTNIMFMIKYLGNIDESKTKEMKLKYKPSVMLPLRGKHGQFGVYFSMFIFLSLM